METLRKILRRIIFAPAIILILLFAVLVFIPIAWVMYKDGASIMWGEIKETLIYLWKL